MAARLERGQVRVVRNPVVIDELLDAVAAALSSSVRPIEPEPDT